jgi:hypothetical protein
MRRLYLKLLVDYAEGRELVTHADWQEIVVTLSESDVDRLRDIEHLYMEVCGLAGGTFLGESVDEACYELNRPRPADVRTLPIPDMAECIALMTSRTLLPAKTCECFIDSETVAIVEAAKAHLSANRD